MNSLFRFSHPSQVVVAAFAAATTVGTLLLMLPFATTSGESARFLDALFTATSAVCVTGLTTVDTATYWSGFGQGVILLLIQIGGLGIMVFATLLALLFARRLGLRARFALQTETRAMSPADMRHLVLRIALFSLVVEAAVATALTVRFLVAYDAAPASALYQGVFHAVSAFNNAGFALYSDSLMGFVSDPWILVPISIAVIVGGLGFPVVFELVRAWRHPKSWSVLTRITVTMTSVLLVLGALVILLEEGNNPGTLAARGDGTILLAGIVTSVMARTAGFNVIDISNLGPESLFATDILMFIGGGSAGTAGGIKVTTIGLLAFVVWSEIRGRNDVEIGRRQVPSTNQRAALAVAVLGITIVVSSAFLMMALTDFEFDRVLFETVSAFATVGLSTGITPMLPDSAQVLVIALMFIGRLGPLTVATGFAMRERTSRRRLPEERMIIG